MVFGRLHVMSNNFLCGKENKFKLTTFLPMVGVLGLLNVSMSLKLTLLEKMTSLERERSRQ